MGGDNTYFRAKLFNTKPSRLECVGGGNLISTTGISPYTLQYFAKSPRVMITSASIVMALHSAR